MQKSKSTDGGCCTTIKSHEIIRKYQTWNSWIHWKCQIQNIRNSKPLIMTLAGMPENRPWRSKYGPSAWKKCEKLKIDPAWPSQILEKNRVRNNHFRRLFVFKVYSNFVSKFLHRYLISYFSLIIVLLLSDLNYNYIFQ